VVRNILLRNKSLTQRETVRNICEVSDLMELARRIVETAKEKHPLDLALEFCRKRRLLPVEVEILMTSVLILSTGSDGKRVFS